ncbi:PREDICTED: Golgi to ER traffic protein 4 homolog isoform X2 [Ceratosolen solmsi marchali]|uniref:Golgi to ER traffic protein 4 homolog isoform X2 n=1 Tax=Ceratosolen solmsi marchali TaxID=326594 RepID=A0AAJ7DT96_9HYME|nr:PREDICTED: Golgi to ER traffic protein 4 homolog isoform X2 [Ceratosolen solmsi marchali]
MEMHSYDGIKRVLLKLENSINNGYYYEAHQIYRTLYFRYLGQKKYLELIQLLYSGSLRLLQCGQHTSGADLGILLIDVLKKSEIEPSQTYFQKIVDLFSLMTPSSPERQTFVQKAVRWSTIGSIFKTGHPNFHQKLAQVYWHEKNYTSARQHFLYTKDGSGCALMLIELHQQQGYSNEMDLFITQTVLQYLCLKNKSTADEAFKSFINKHPKIKGGPPFLLPLLNFSFFLLKTIESGQVTIFTILCEQYLSSLTKDPSFLQYIDKIGQLFFNIQPRQNSNRGLLNSFLQSFFDGLEDENNENRTMNTLTSHLISDFD